MKNVNYLSMIYPGSMITVKEFIFVFLWLCSTLKLNQTQRVILLDFIARLLPSDNLLTKENKLPKLEKYI